MRSFIRFVSILLLLLLLSTPNLLQGQSRSERTSWEIIDDFLVNDDSASDWDQQNPAIAQKPSGEFIITWEDYRNGNWDIYAQRFSSSGAPLGINFKVNEDFSIATDQFFPAISVDSSGGFVIAWEDYRYGNSDIFAQRYDSSGSPLGAEFKVNDDIVSAQQYRPAVALDNSGNFVLAWTDERNGDNDIYAQRYDSTGVPSGSNFKVNDDSAKSSQELPSIALDGSGNFVLSWADFRNGSWDIYVQRYSYSGIPLETNFRVNDDIGSSYQRSPDIASDLSGNFIITWRDERQGNSDIYAQRFDSSGTRIGSNFKVNEDAGVSYQGYPSIAMNGSGNFVITWTDFRNGHRDIYAQRYDSSGISLDSNFKANDDTGATYQHYPAIALDESGNFVITWQDGRNGNYDIYAQRYEFAGAPLGSNFKTNDDLGASDQESPSICADLSGNFILTWQDYRNDNWDIFAQRYNSSGAPSGINFRVNVDSGTAHQRYPAMAIDSSGNFILTWQDQRNGNYEIYAQRYNYSGIPLGTNFKVNEDIGTIDRFSPAIAVDGLGNFVIVWEANSDIYAQRYNSSGLPLGSNFRINDDSGVASQSFPAIAMQSSGDFVLAWKDYRKGRYDIYAQRYDVSGTPLGFNFRVNDDTLSFYNEFPVIAMDCLGNFVIAWQDKRNGNYDIYVQRYDFSGIPLGSNFKVNNDSLPFSQKYPAIAMNCSGNFILAWQDYRNRNSDVYAQRYSYTGIPLGENYLVINPEYASFDQLAPTVALNGSSIFFTWIDNRRGKGWDIYAKVVDWNWTEVREEQLVGMPKSFGLYQNFPNPFNSTTTIPFTVVSSQLVVHRPIHTTLKIYNILGQLVRILLDEEKEPRNYNIIWDGKDDSGKQVASGIYFYQLKTKDYTATRKMVLLR